MISLSKIFAPRHDDMCLVNSQLDEVFLKSLVTENRIDIRRDQSLFCRKTYDRPSTLTNSLQQISALSLSGLKTFSG
ncbi:hypothetical protein K443DRAFT_518164 [Laccaria amethystina LaAM-08-1]|uniref:Uncharacterized protein n=1 Tax=Laccaria amethystina LaAM-08-1 TaxID=1095629 RepID=A0A0C9Y333_9AGAR|nr:hypothetical protein K443DRAFT_518164 [Laccaria amethystina LaAM-08-1]